MFANMGIGSLILIVLLVVLLFGTKKLRGLGSDLGSAVKGFKKAMDNDDKQDADFDAEKQQQVSHQAPVNKTETRHEVKDKS